MEWKVKNADLNSELFCRKNNFPARFTDSSSTATFRASDSDHLGNFQGQKEPKTLDDDIKERLSTLESSLGFDGSKSDILTRLKILEDKMLRIEENFPQVAVRVFKYEPEALKGVGRLSKAPESFNDMNQAANMKNRRIEELKARMGQLKDALNK